jgi:flagellar hook-length control protein FliK
MSIETSAPSPGPRTGSTGESRTTKSAGRTQTGDASPVGFLAALSAADEAADAPGPAGAPDFVSNAPLARVDIAQAATDLIANFMQLPSPQADNSAAQLASMLPGAAMASGDTPTINAAGSAAAGIRLNPLGAATVQGPSVLQASQPGDALSDQALATDPGGAGASPKAGETQRAAKAQGASLVLNANVSDAGKEHDAKFLAALEAMKTIQVAREPASQAAGIPTAAVSAGWTIGEKYQKRDSTADGVVASLATTAGVSGFGDSSIPGVVATVPAGQVAEQVAFWISTDVHKAELKLEGLGENAVEVSIRMAGNEAHVTFRTDELQARGALEGAADHLKDLLQREGLVLSGISIGASGGGHPGAQERRQQEPLPQMATVAVPNVVRDRMLSATGVAGRTLDLFV